MWRMLAPNPPPNAIVRDRPPSWQGFNHLCRRHQAEATDATSVSMPLAGPCRRSPTRSFAFWRQSGNNSARACQMEPALTAENVPAASPAPRAGLARRSDNGREEVFSRIMAPVDLAHVEKLGRALECAADLAKHYGLPVTYVGITAAAPSKVAHNPEEFARRLAAFAGSQAEKYGIEAVSHAVVAHDPATEIDHTLMKAINDTGADLVVMASHVPNVIDHIWPSHGGKLAEHAKCSVMVVRS